MPADNDPRGKRPFTAEIGGPAFREPLRMEGFERISDARWYAETFRSRANWCNIYNSEGTLVGRHVRDERVLGGLGGDISNGETWHREYIAVELPGDQTEPPFPDGA